MSQVEQVKSNIIKCNNEVFIRSTYNTINIIIRKKDNFINATQMCNQFNRRFRKIYENHAWQEYYEEFKQEYYNKRLGPEMGQVPKYEIKKEYYHNEGCPSSDDPIYRIIIIKIDIKLFFESFFIFYKTL